MSLKWEGDKLVRNVSRAQKVGVDRTMSEAVVSAKRIHEWNNRTGTLEGSISIAEYAHPSGTGFKGTWGSKDVVYAMIHELGGKIVPRHAKALVFQIAGKWVRTQSVTIPARPYLRPAAAFAYPNLARNIREAL